MPCPEKFRDSFALFNIPPELAARVNEGYEELAGSSPKKERAAYFKRAVEILEKELPPETFASLMQWNACCKSGARQKAAKTFAKENAALSIQERLPLIKNVPNMGEAVLNDDGTITLHAVRFWDGEKYNCACTNFNGVKLDEPVSKGYCHCCAGHFLFYYQIMLGVKLKVTQIVTSPLDSNGKEPCVMKMQIQQ